MAEVIELHKLKVGRELNMHLLRTLVGIVGNYCFGNVVSGKIRVRAHGLGKKMFAPTVTADSRRVFTFFVQLNS